MADVVKYLLTDGYSFHRFNKVQVLGFSGDRHASLECVRHALLRREDIFASCEYRIADSADRGASNATEIFRPLLSTQAEAIWESINSPQHHHLEETAREY